MLTARVWRLTIDRSCGAAINVYGQEEILRQEFDDWVAFETKCCQKAEQLSETGTELTEFVGGIPRVIEGMSDSADRTQVSVAYRFHDVTSMALTEI